MPLKLAQRAAPDTPAGFEFVVSFGIGAVAVTAVCWALYLAIGVGLLGWRWPSLHVHDGVMSVPGAVAGLAWSAGCLFLGTPFCCFYVATRLWKFGSLKLTKE